MIEFFLNELLPILMNSFEFLLKSGIVALFVFLILFLFMQMNKEKVHPKPRMEIENLGLRYEGYYLQIKKTIMGKKPFDKLNRRMKKQRKDTESKNIHGPALFVLDFEGDMKANQVSSFREEVSAVLSAADPKKDEVLIRLENHGGYVHSHGLGASQLKRIRDKMKLTICVDKVAGSGGYMMACVANKLISAPFAAIGSVGVISQITNIHRFLKKYDMDHVEATAGEFKRNVTVRGELTDEKRKALDKKLAEIHGMFKDFVKENRPSLDVEKIATGEVWYGIKAKELGLIDDILTSDDYIARAIKENKKVFKVSLKVRKNWMDKISDKLAQVSFLNHFFKADGPGTDHLV